MAASSRAVSFSTAASARRWSAGRPLSARLGEIKLPLERLDAVWRQDNAAMRDRLLDIKGRLVDAVAAAAASGELAEAKAIALLRELRAEMQA
jgi:hypothetical protein